VRTKDRPRLLKRALRSIFAQTYRPIEVVLVNDGGCDLDIEEIKSMLGEISLNYIRLETNTGRAHAGNIGIENAKGEYLGLLDDDDELYPDHIATLAAMLLNGPNMIAYADAETVFMELDEDGNFIEKGKQLSYRHDFTPEVFFIQNYIPFMCLLTGRFSTICSMNLTSLRTGTCCACCLQQYRFTHISKITSKYNHGQTNRRSTAGQTQKISARRPTCGFFRRIWDCITLRSLCTECRHEQREITHHH
jgi:hypothetical protein